MTFSEWQSFAHRVSAMAERIQRSKLERAKKLAISAGIGPDMCCIHNASISEIGHGWGAGNSKADGRTVIKTARAAKRLWDDFTASHLADRIISRAWQKVAR